MTRLPLTVFILGCLVHQTLAAESHRHWPEGSLEQEAARLLTEQAQYVRCDEQHFIFGVGYIDGSYMERIFFVEGSGDRPVVKVEFRGNPPDGEYGRGQADPDLAPVPFVIEIEAPRVLYATPAGAHWQRADGDWETALRFKYTSWFGEIRRENGKWEVEWQGYRRPMLPESVTGNRAAICAMFVAQ